MHRDRSHPHNKRTSAVRSSVSSLVSLKIVKIMYFMNNLCYLTTPIQEWDETDTGVQMTMVVGV